MAFSDRGSLLQAPPKPIQGAARFLSATSGLCSGRHSYVLLLAPPLKNPKVTFGCCRDALVTKVPGVGWIQSAKVPPTQSISTTCRDRLGLVYFVRK